MANTAIYVFAPDLSRPLGGMRMLYRHVDILNANGREAYIVHASRKFRIDWFEYSTPVLRGPIKMNDEDIAVYSEIGGLKILNWAKGKRKVIFNQNAYYTFARYPLQGNVKTPYMHPEVVGTIVVSEDSKNYLQYVFPKLPIYRICYSIEPKRYYMTGKKKKQICFMPRKNLADAQQVLYLLRYRGVLRGWKVVAIDKVSEEEAAAIIRDSLLFLSFGHPEGFGLPPAEAMLSGCITIGYDGRGGSEFWKGHGIQIDMGDVVGYARAVEEVIERLDAEAEPLRTMVKSAAEYIRTNYSPEAERESILSCWRQIMGLGRKD